MPGCMMPGNQVCCSGNVQPQDLKYGALGVPKMPGKEVWSSGNVRRQELKYGVFSVLRCQVKKNMVFWKCAMPGFEV